MHWISHCLGCSTLPSCAPRTRLPWPGGSCICPKLKCQGGQLAWWERCKAHRAKVAEVQQEAAGDLSVLCWLIHHQMSECWQDWVEPSALGALKVGLHRTSLSWTEMRIAVCPHALRQQGTTHLLCQHCFPGCFFPFSVYHPYRLFSFWQLPATKCWQTILSRGTIRPALLSAASRSPWGTAQGQPQSSSAAGRHVERSTLCSLYLGGWQSLFPSLFAWAFYSMSFFFFLFSWVCGFSILVVRMVLPCGIWERDFCGFQEKRP